MKILGGVVLFLADGEKGGENEEPVDDEQLVAEFIAVKPLNGMRGDYIA